MNKEPSGEECTERMCAAPPGPLEDQIVEIEKTKLFIAKYCKKMMAISTAQEKSKIEAKIFYIDLSPNMTREEFMSTSWLEKVQSIRFSIRAAGHKAATVEGIVTLQIKVGAHVTIAVLRFTPKLATKVIFVTAFFEKEIKRIEINNQNVVSCGVHAVALIGIFEDKTAVKSLSDVKTQDDETCVTNLPTQKLTKNSTIPP